MNSDFFGHEWDDLPIIFTSDGVTGENDLSMIVTSDEVKIIDKSHHELRKKSSFSVTNDYFISWTLSFILNTQFRWKQSPTAHLTIVAKDSISFWRHHSWSVTSIEREVIVTSYSTIVFARANWRKGDLHLWVTTVSIDFSPPNIHDLAWRK